MIVMPNWQPATHVRCAVTTMAMGNLATHVGDDPTQNRQRLAAELGIKRAPQWLNQVHGNRVVEVSQISPTNPPNADGAFTRSKGLPLAVLTADCLPIFISDTKGEQIAVVHAGWRGLDSGIIANAVKCFDAGDLSAYLGPGIGPCHYEVDSVVKEAMPSSVAFERARPGHWFFDLAEEAEHQLRGLGVDAVNSSGVCVACDERFYSHRSEREVGRFASLIWIEADAC